MSNSTTIATRWRRNLDSTLLALFVGGIAAPTLDQIVRPGDARGPARELRMAAEEPRAPRTPEDIARFPARFEAYYKDYFGLRDKLLRWNSVVKFFVYGVGPSANLIPSSTDWICYAGDRTLDVARGVMPFEPAELAGWQARIEGRRDALAKHGIAYLFVMIPNKESVYPERLPAAFNNVGPSRLEQLVRHLAATSNARILDLRPAFARAKAHDRPGDYLYNQLGTHWTARGSETAYVELVRALREHFPATPLLTRGEYLITDSFSNHDTWAMSMYVADILLQREQDFYPERRFAPELMDGISDNPRHQVVSRVDSPGPRALVYHDSFLPFFEGVLGASFKRLETVWANAFSMKDVEHARPDIVLEIFVERALVQQTPFVDPPEDVPFPALEGVDGWVRKSLLGGAGTAVETLFEGGTARLAPGVAQGDLSTVWFDAAPAQNLTIDLVLDSDMNDYLDMYWRSTPSENWIRRNRISLQIRAGKHAYSERVLWTAGERGQVLVRKRSQDSDQRIESFEIRTLVKAP